MAADWIIEECERNEDFGPNGDATTPGVFLKTNTSEDRSLGAGPHTEEPVNDASHRK
jgi:hypothetical protein